MRLCAGIRTIIQIIKVDRMIKKASCIRVRRLLPFLFFFVLQNAAKAQPGKATWIWYPGDFEIWLSNQMQTKRTERNAFIPPFWKMYSHQVVVNFSRNYDLAASEEVNAAVEGQYNVTIDGKYVQTGIQRI